MPEKRTVSAKEVVADIRAGASDDLLMSKYGLSEKGLQSVLNKLLCQNGQVAEFRPAHRSLQIHLCHLIASSQQAYASVRSQRNIDNGLVGVLRGLETKGAFVRINLTFFGRETSANDDPH